MGNSISFDYKSYEHLIYRGDGHYHIDVPTFYHHGSYSNDAIDFIFDTGAFITVIMPVIANYFGFNEIPPIIKDFSLSGFVGACEAEVKVIPGMIIGGYLLENVKVAIPKNEMTYQNIDGGRNILGLNVLEYFNYYIDNTKDMIYFSQNPAPEIPDILKCGRVHLLEIQSITP